MNCSIISQTEDERIHEKDFALPTYAWLGDALVEFFHTFSTAILV